MKFGLKKNGDSELGRELMDFEMNEIYERTTAYCR